jgi:hypothetical protein
MFAKVKGFGGVACTVLGPVKVWEPDVFFGEDEDGNECECSEAGEGEWVDGDGSRMRVRMVGDDKVHEVDSDDIEEIPDDAFCLECGQMGCMHGRADW